MTLGNPVRAAWDGGQEGFRPLIFKGLKWTWRRDRAAAGVSLVVSLLKHGHTES